MYKDYIGGFFDFYYWSSTEKDSREAWLQLFTNGDQETINKLLDDNFYRVRAVRAF